MTSDANGNGAFSAYADNTRGPVKLSDGHHHPYYAAAYGYTMTPSGLAWADSYMGARVYGVFDGDEFVKKLNRDGKYNSQNPNYDSGLKNTIKLAGQILGCL